MTDAFPLVAGGLMMLVAVLLLPRRVRGRPIALGGVAAVLLIGGLLYALTGEPRVPDRPTARVVPVGAPAARAMFGAARQALLMRPDNIPAWIELSVAATNAGETARAVEAMRQATSVIKDQPALWVAYGEALIAHGGGMVSPAARLALDRASQLDPSSPAPRYYLGLAWLQAGKPDQALEVWRALLKDSPADAPWRADVTRKINAAETMLASGVGS